MAQNESGKSGAKHPGGRPLIFKTPEAMQEKIDAYFKACEGVLWLDENSMPIQTKYGLLYKVNPEPPTMTGLALAIGLNSRQALLNYQGREKFNDTVTRAKSKVEKYAEIRLFDKDGANGAKFSLANNFKCWTEKSESTITGDLTIKIDLIDD